jgi:Domain of unknown function (DUF4276)
VIRVHIICEGQTEEMFINKVLAGLYSPKGIYLYPSLIGKPGHKGGNVRYERLLTDLRARLAGDSTAYCTTLFDYYGLPRDFPGKEEAKEQVGTANKALCVTRALTERLGSKLGEGFLRRFIPYVQMHEFEGLLFSDSDSFAKAINMPNLANDFRRIRAGFESPEEINDDPDTAPSKRIKALFPRYEKPLYGSLATMEIGIEAIRAECPLFNRWLEQIESIAVIGE